MLTVPHMNRTFLCRGGVERSVPPAPTYMLPAAVKTQACCKKGCKASSTPDEDGLRNLLSLLASRFSSVFSLKIHFALVAFLLVGSGRAEVNVTIDDTDPRIVYQPPGVWDFQGNVRPCPLHSPRSANAHRYRRRP
jgi:hypothetical protein